MSERSYSSTQVFGPSGRAAVQRCVVAVIYVLMLLGTAVFIGWLVVAARGEVFADHPILGLAIGALLGLVITLAGWESIRTRFQATLEITPSHIHLGRGWARESVSCNDIEVIRLGGFGLTGSLRRKGIELQVRGRRRRFLVNGQEEACAKALRACCPHAIYIDARGMEHMPTGEDRPLLVLGNLAREQLRRGWAFLALALIILVAAVPGCLYLLVMAAREGVEAGGGIPLAVLLPLSLAFGVALLVISVLRIRRAHKLGAEVRGLQDKGGAGEADGR